MLPDIEGDATPEGMFFSTLNNWDVDEADLQLLACLEEMSLSIPISPLPTCRSPTPMEVDPDTSNSSWDSVPEKDPAQLTSLLLKAWISPGERDRTSFTFIEAWCDILGCTQHVEAHMDFPPPMGHL